MRLLLMEAGRAPGRAPRQPSLEAGEQGLLPAGKTNGGVAFCNM